MPFRKAATETRCEAERCSSIDARDPATLGGRERVAFGGREKVLYPIATDGEAVVLAGLVIVLGEIAGIGIADTEVWI